MDVSLFQQILTRCESDNIDFKQTQYDLDGGDKPARDVKRAKLAKDIISMANTPRKDTAYIVLGVKKNVDGSFELLGIVNHYDDAELQDKLKDIVYPLPLFSYEILDFESLRFGIISIPVDKNRGPYFATADIGGTLLRRNQLYFRRSSQNAEANHADHREIMRWFMVAGEDEDTIVHTESPSWDKFMSSVNNFSSKRHYVLVVPPFVADSPLPLENIGHLPWDFVIDFDRNSDVNGILSKCKGILEERRVLHRITKGDSLTINVNHSTYWYFANGLQGRDSTPESKSWLEWQRQYNKDLSEVLARLARSSGASPVTVVALWDPNFSTKYLESALSAIASAFGESVTFTVVSGDVGPLGTLESEYEASVIETRIGQWLSGLAAFATLPSSEAGETCILPSATGAPIQLSSTDLMWLGEELELIHSGTGYHPSSENTPGRDFLRGAEVSWYDLGLHYDVERDRTAKVSHAIRNDLSKRQVARINLYHKPGAGGTTIAKRILWNFHNDIPCAILKRTEPKETAERLAKIVALTGHPILIALDGSVISEADSTELFEVLSSRQIPTVMLQVLRRFANQQERDRSFFVSNLLSPLEAGRFYYTLIREAPHSSTALQGAVRSTNPNERTPFFLTLLAFGHEVQSVKKYVSYRTNYLTPVQNKVLLYISVAHYYGQKSVPAQSFASILGLHHSTVVNFTRIFDELCLELLVENRSGFWRTSHQLIAAALLKELTVGSKGEDERLWTQHLSDIAIDFANFCRGSLPETPSEMLELAQRVFVFRDNSDLLGTERSGSSNFSELLLNIPSLEGRQRVLEHLTEIFPREAHFWAHLGRFYFLEKKDFANAIQAIDTAIYLQPDDRVLMHVKGMAIRAAAYHDIEQREDVMNVLKHAKLASDAFQRARIMNPTDEHGYISEVQMIIRVLDYVGRMSSMPAPRAAAMSSDPWLQESFQVAEDLLMLVRRERVGDSQSDYERRCRADLDALYGKHDSALQIWDNLLQKDSSQKSTIFAPPIRRQIVWTYLARRGHSWERLNPHEIQKCITLLEANLKEESYTEKDLRLWLQTIRWQKSPPPLEQVIEKVAYWKTNTDSLEASYYLYVLYTLDALGGSAISKESAARTLEECKLKSRFRTNRSKSFEWLGSGTGIKQLVHHELLGEWDYSKNFWAEERKLVRIKGLITKIDAPQAGEIEIANGLTAFFVPSKSDHQKGRSENTPITCYIGFSYDGLKAWSVEDA